MQQKLCGFFYNSQTILKNCLVFLSISTLFFAQGDEYSYILFNEKTDQIANLEGTGCDKRYSPASTFKIVLSLIGYDTKILTSLDTPAWTYEGYDALSDRRQITHTPTTWIDQSVVWYSQILASLIGLNHIQEYLDKFDYGNKDMEGDPGKNNGLTKGWLNSSLKISPIEQIHFLKKMVREKLPVSSQALEMTKKLLFLGEIQKEWLLYGKTGTYFNREDQNHISWFVGWIEKEAQKYIFVLNKKTALKVPSRKERIDLLEGFLKNSKVL